MNPSRRTLARAGAALLVVALLVPAGVSALTASPTDFKAGTVTEPADGPTVVGIQGFHFEGQGAEKKPARLASIDGDGTFGWQYGGRSVNGQWFYDVDPLPNGNLLVVSTNPDNTVVYEFDRETREPVWIERLDLHDTHDVDLMPNGDLVVADMRNNTGDAPNDQLFIYNRTTDERTWQWRFADHYPESTDGGYTADWTHLNDVDVIDEHRLLASPRNFDQVIVVNRTTDEIEMRLGADDNHSVLDEQHNPDFLVSEDGNPTILVADSENDRVVEYERRCAGDPMTAPMEECSWELMWELGVDGGLNWPRDADRLPNGNTLVTDSLNHRVIEVTPDGEVVWEYYATWGPYDAERLGAKNVSADWTGGSARGPTMADTGDEGAYTVTGSANDPPVPSDLDGGPAAVLRSAGLDSLATTWRHVTPWAKPVWMTGWDFLLAVLALLGALVWAGTELAVNRERIAARVRALR